MAEPAPAAQASDSGRVPDARPGAVDGARSPPLPQAAPMRAPGAGFHKLSRYQRLRVVAEWAGLEPAELGTLTSISALPHTLSDQFVENSLGNFPLPLGLAVNFVVDGTPVAIPMAIEESSVVAAASHGAKLAAAGGGFHTKVQPPVSIGQVELRKVRNPAAARRIVARNAKDWIKSLNESIPSMVARGGGVRAIQARAVGKGRIVLHLHVDTRDAMGANTVNTLCETLAPLAAKEIGAEVGLRILSNLADTRLVTVKCRVPEKSLGGRKLVDAIVAANEFALADPYRAATHNKGIMNGIDGILIATGNDWRAVEAGAHAFAARDGHYRALTKYRRAKDGALEAELTLPLPVGTVGGVTHLHPSVPILLKILGKPDAQRLAAIVASAGLAQNLAALRALAGEGIQKGHMRMHAMNVAMSAGIPESRMADVAARMQQDGNVSVSRARELARQ